MGEEYNRELCDEKHKGVDKSIEDLKELVKTLFEKLDDFRNKYNNRLNWFYVVAVSALLSMIGNMALTFFNK